MPFLPDLTDLYPEGFRDVSEPKRRRKRVACPIRNAVQAWAYLKEKNGTEEFLWNYRLHDGRVEWLSTSGHGWVPITMRKFVDYVRTDWYDNTESEY